MRRVLVTGATGYIGGRLVPELLGAGYQVRCLARTPAKLAGHSWRDRVEVQGSRLEQRARFTPRGLWGRVYWYSLLPFHTVIFRPMARRIAEAAALPAGTAGRGYSKGRRSQEMDCPAETRSPMRSSIQG
jgi:nucleoside-diphosphate-sugar epimerase